MTADPMPSEHVTHGPEETEALAARLAARLCGGEVIRLHGALGAGKTAFVRGLARGLGADPREISSPSFALMHVHAVTTRASGPPAAARMPSPVRTLVHVDAWRMVHPDEFIELGLDAWLHAPGTVVAIEWPERLGDALAAGRIIDVTISSEGGDRRRIRIARSSPDS